MKTYKTLMEDVKMTLQESLTDTLDYVKSQHGEGALKHHEMMSHYGYKFKTANSKGSHTTVTYQHPRTKAKIHLQHGGSLGTSYMNHDHPSDGNLVKDPERHVAVSAGHSYTSIDAPGKRILPNPKK